MPKLPVWSSNFTGIITEGKITTPGHHLYFITLSPQPKPGPHHVRLCTDGEETPLPPPDNSQHRAVSHDYHHL